MKYGKIINPIYKVPKGKKKEAMRRAIEKYRKDKDGNISKNVRPFKPKLPAKPLPKPMPKPPNDKEPYVGRPVSGRPISGMPGMTYRGGKKQRTLASMQKQRVLAKMKKMRENA
jgi:hypothetical protein